MRPKLSLLTTAAALAFGLTGTAALAEDPVGDAPGAKSDITIVKDATSNAPAGVQGQAAPDEDNAAIPDSNDGGAAAQGDPPANDDGGAAAQSGGQYQDDNGAMAAEPPVKEGKLPSPNSSY
jgi:hypothetical protein